MYFPYRIPEPQIMKKTDLDSFRSLSCSRYARWFIPLADDILGRANLIEGNMLDIGCGPGLLIKELAGRYCSNHIRFVGVDSSLYALRLAQQECHNMRNVAFLKADAERLPFSNNSFDVVVSKDSLHEFRFAKTAIKEMMRVLKIGGLLYVQDLKRDLPISILRQSLPPNTPIKKLQYYSARAAYTRKEVRKLLTGLPFQSLRVFTRHVTPVIQRRYTRKKINLGQLRESFQSRYVIVARKGI